MKTHNPPHPPQARRVEGGMIFDPFVTPPVFCKANLSLLLLLSSLRSWGKTPPPPFPLSVRAARKQVRRRSQLIVTRRMTARSLWFRRRVADALAAL